VSYLFPSVGYEQKMGSLLPKQKGMILNKLRIYRMHLMKEFDIPKELIAIDEKKFRILTTMTVVHQLSKYIKESNMKPAIVTEYPTWDQLIVELEWM
jgi:pyruvate formate-lyase activating enzyme-like uncharacterized protein